MHTVYVSMYVLTCVGAVVLAIVLAIYMLLVGHATILVVTRLFSYCHCVILCVRLICFFSFAGIVRYCVVLFFYCLVLFGIVSIECIKCITVYII